jgi:hypothetical protein
VQHNTAAQLTLIVRHDSEVKRTYGLTVTDAQTAELAELSTGCGR